jgi:hypothetical protein
MLGHLVSLATVRLLLRGAPRDSLALMKKLALISVLLLAASPATAQVVTSLSEAQLGGQSIQSARTQAPTTGVECTEEMTATFCNVPSGPSEGGYGSGGVSTLSSASGTSSVSAPSTSTSIISSSVPPCPSEPPFNELCN